LGVAHPFGASPTPIDQLLHGVSPSPALAQLLPAGVALEVIDPSLFETVDTLHVEEETAVTAATEKRRQEFRVGRAAARAALGRFGVVGATIPRGADRLPIWPDGFVGSISHCPGWCAAAVARRRDFAAIGLDVEVRRRVRPELHTTLCTPTELAWMAIGDRGAETATLLFGAKEAVYKCVYPMTRARLAFTDVEVAVDLPSGALEAFLPDRLPSAWRRLAGRFALEPGHVISVFCLPAKATPR
jgi:4'-phosphopantetheinyl transferase EntD